MPLLALCQYSTEMLPVPYRGSPAWGGVQGSAGLQGPSPLPLTKEETRSFLIFLCAPHLTLLLTMSLRGGMVLVYFALIGEAQQSQET